MIEGLIAVSASVENSHKAMKMLEVTDLANAKSSINDFLMNYERANVLNKSMVANSDGDFFWEDYQGTSYEFSYIFIKNKCDNGKFVDFCKMIKERADDPHYDETELYETLHEFAQADARGKVNYQKQARRDNYKEYREYLQFTSSKTSTPQDLSELEKEVAGQPSEIKKVHDLQAAIKDYEDNKDEATAQKIVKLSNELSDISMNFNNGMKFDDNDIVAKDIKNHFEKGLTSVASAAGILTGENNIKNNFKTVKKSLDIELKGKESSLLEKHKGVLGKLEGDCDVSKTSEIKDCLKSICGSSYPKGCAKSGEYPGIEGLLIDHNNFDEANTLREANSRMLECLDIDYEEKTKKSNNYDQKKSVTELKQTCLDENLEKLDLSENKLQEAKDELIQAKKSLDFINHGKNVKDILAAKFITIKMLKANHCLNSNSKTEAGYLNSYCDIQQMNIHIKTALKLSTDVEDVLLKYNPEQYQDFIDGKGKYGENKDGDTYFDRMVSDCEDDKQSSSVCAYFISENKKKKDEERKEKEKQAQKDMIYKGAYNVYEEYDAAGDGNYDDGPSGFSYAMSGLATGAIKNMPGIFGYYQQRKSHQNQMQMWDNQINYHNYYYGSGATHHTNNVTINYDDWYANQNTFNPGGYKYFNPTNSLFFPNVAPSTLGSPNMPLYTPASQGASGFNFN